MIEEAAIVTRIDAGQVWIKALQGGACGGCIQQSTCGTAALSKWLPKREFAVDCDRSLNVGDRVTVAIDDSHLLLSSLVLYLLPILSMLGGVGLANVFLPETVADAWLPEISLAILLLTFWLIHRFQNLLLLHFCFMPQISGKV
ncbi:MAG: SoxR reducing system RseC family protein [Methylomonas sp.]|nr:SoxR reducing system RseC family protein [Methylomonas sp.]